MRNLTISVLLAFVALCIPAFATTYNVKTTGSDANTCVQAQSAATPKATITGGVGCLANGDTLVVFAGSYAENVTVPAGGTGAYKTVTVNGSDIVSVLSFTLGSHTKLIGNCPEKQGTKTAAACGFFIANTASPGNAACVSIGANTDVYVVHNVMYACATGLGNASNTAGPAITTSTGSSFIYIQGNTIDYPAATVGNPVFTGIGMLIKGDNTLVENNDLSHYTLGVKYESNSNCIFRNNVFHDQLESEASSNQHTDIFFSEPGIAVTTQHELMEGNLERNAVGPNAKGPLEQNESCGGLCSGIIFRFNTISRIGSGAVTNDKSWPYVKLYNNTFVDEGQESGFNTPGGGGDNMSSSGAGLASLNNLWFTGTQNFTSWNPVQCSGCVSYGHSLAYCVGTCTIYGHIYQSGAFTADPGNIVANPLFVNYVSPGSASNNFELQSNSPAKAAGTFLTTVAAGDSGSGTSLIVADANFFQDGYGLSNANSTVSPDCIAVNTAANHVCITAVNYGTNTLTLASPITRSAGQGVYLYSKSDGVQVLTGSAPDMGAFPFSTSIITPPSQLTVLDIGY